MVSFSFLPSLHRHQHQHQHRTRFQGTHREDKEADENVVSIVEKK